MLTFLVIRVLICLEYYSMSIIIYSSVLRKRSACCGHASERGREKRKRMKG